MSTFTVIALVIVSYFALGGLILGLIQDDFELGENIIYWPAIVIQFIAEVIDDIQYVIAKRFDGLEEVAV